MPECKSMRRPDWFELIGARTLTLISCWCSRQLGRSQVDSRVKAKGSVQELEHTNGDRTVVIERWQPSNSSAQVPHLDRDRVATLSRQVHARLHCRMIGLPSHASPGIRPSQDGPSAGLILTLDL